MWAPVQLHTLPTSCPVLSRAWNWYLAHSFCGLIADVGPLALHACSCSVSLAATSISVLFLCGLQVLPAMIAKKSGTILLTGATASLRGGASFATLGRRTLLYREVGMNQLAQCR